MEARQFPYGMKQPKPFIPNPMSTPNPNPNSNQNQNQNQNPNQYSQNPQNFPNYRM